MTEKILFVLPSFAGGGAERVMISLANRLDRSKFFPLLIVLDGDGPLRQFAADDLPVIDLGRPRVRDALKPLIAAIQEVSPRAVVPTMGYLNLALLYRRKQIPERTKIIVREANEVDATIQSIRIPLLGRFLYKWLYPRADLIISPTLGIQRDFRRRWKIPAQKLFLLPNPVDIDYLRDQAGMVQREPGEGRRFVAAGRLVDQKGFDRLIEWLPEVPPNTHLTIFGDGPMGGALRFLTQKHGISNRVRFAGYINNPWVAFAGADAFLLPSRWEGMPNAALEALAVGTPVIATPEAGGIVDVAEQADAGAVTIARQGSDFIDAMNRVVAAPPVDPRPCLLPEAYSLDRATKQFESILLD